MTDFQFQMQTWGYSVLGSRLDFAANVCESRWNDDTYLRGVNMTYWDADRKYLDTVTFNGGRCPEKFALWWVCEHERRDDVA